jgi:hypothetical protein
MIQLEQQCTFWHKLNYVTGKKRTRSPTSVQVEGQDRAIMEHTTQDTVEQIIFSEIHKKHFALTGEAPICNRELIRDFGYTANTPALRAVLHCTYAAPTTSDDTTKELFAEIAAIQRLVPESLVSIIITPEQYKQYWKVVNEETLSSELGLLIGHSIVASKSDIISHYHASRVTVILAHAIQLERWSRGLLVMLEKTLGIILVTKLCAILLMVGDFNAVNKVVYGVRMLDNMRKHNLMAEDIYSKKMDG